jgi:hypothetical protein
MSENLQEKSGDTIRILRPPPRVYTDTLGRNVWMGEVDPLELVLEEPLNTDPYNSASVTEPARYRPSRGAEIPGK